MGNAHAQGDGAQAELRRGREEATIEKHGVTTVEDYRSGPPVTRFREGAVVRPQELFSKMMRSVASTFKTTGDVAGALRHAPAYLLTWVYLLVDLR